MCQNSHIGNKLACKTHSERSIQLHDRPAHVDDFKSLGGVDQSCHFFCATHWVEDKLVAERLIAIWPNIIKLMDYYGSLQKSKQ